MTPRYSLAPALLGMAAALAPAGGTHAQAPTLVAVSPAANAVAAPRTAPLVVTASQPLTAASAGALRVFSGQRGGLRTRPATPAQATGSTLSFAPTAYPYLPGETVQYTVTTAAAGSGGALARPRVGQFTTAVGGSGRGYFQAGADLVVGSSTYDVGLADVDNDGDLDLLVVDANSRSVQIRLNDGSGNFSGSQSVAAGYSAYSVTPGDVDGDGDLDLLVANFGGNSLSVCLNNGGGNFSPGQQVPVPAGSLGATLADVDGDGDLDLLSSSPYTSTVHVRVNNGQGTFTGTQDVPVGGQNNGMATGDVDGDGDVDFAVANKFSNTVSVRLNDGSGLFGGTQDVAVGTRPNSVALADVDNDGDLDLLATTEYGGTSVRLNNGSGLFGGTQNVALADGGWKMAMADVDADGDLDLVATGSRYPNLGAISVQLNDGTGVFSGLRTLPFGSLVYGVAAGDLDGDGDLDLVTANYDNASTVSVRFNQAQPLATAGAAASLPALAAFPNPTTGRTALALPPAATSAEVLDGLGRVLRTVPARAGSATLDVAGLAPGLYLVRAAGQVARLVVE
ncbi:FG-GAP-like repeat-containing protein [Hymenobacter negativus]|uniref:VCBS repeat-containing protein n=1 Tax=Hymenobacter negativus TaxID=2795026 RepID=A0ABS0QBL4_9BACT|nr:MULTISPECIES: FG-GAP-like repeat-containing protein [Bacteria]MBH8560060.1 VCBS repeat-containing protein [Hymenobacter negativus]MBH8570529.1 VCBS repeat-containing protein [Hymenobacter negativus]MBR7210268.1 VCBS repeat-containing protein [Microvirga sp. STS02]